MSTDIQAGRLTMRCEGDNWNAYYAPPHDMKCAIFLGSIRLSVVVRSGVRMLIFLQLMQDVAADLIEAEVGIRPTWGYPTSAPEHEITK